MSDQITAAQSGNAHSIKSVEINATIGVIERRNKTYEMRLEEKGQIIIHDGKATLIGTRANCAFGRTSYWTDAWESGGFISKEECQQIIEDSKEKEFSQGNGRVRIKLSEDISLTISYED